MDIAEIKKKYGDRLALIGNIDCGDLLCFGTPQQVREKVKWTIKAAGYNGGFILASSNSIHSSVKPENYLAMCQACREFGAYPLRH
jgi:uroporphyrinogen decarboxylase